MAGDAIRCDTPGWSRQTATSCPLYSHIEGVEIQCFENHRTDICLLVWPFPLTVMIVLDHLSFNVSASSDLHYRSRYQPCATVFNVRNTLCNHLYCFLMSKPKVFDIKIENNYLLTFWCTKPGGLFPLDHKRINPADNLRNISPKNKKSFIHPCVIQNF